MPGYPLHMRLSPLPLLALLALAACGSRGPEPAATPRATALDRDELKASAPLVGELLRAAQVCGVPVSLTGQDRAARIERAALDLALREGGQPAYDTYLRSVQPPAFEARLRGRDRAQYCGGKRIDIERVDGFLNGQDGEALTRRAEALRAGLR